MFRGKRVISHYSPLNLGNRLWIPTTPLGGCVAQVRAPAWEKLSTLRFRRCEGRRQGAVPIGGGEPQEVQRKHVRRTLLYLDSGGSRLSDFDTGYNGSTIDADVLLSIQATTLAMVLVN